MHTQEVQILVTKDIMTTIPVRCYAHEVPLYEARHPEGRVVVDSVIQPRVMLDDGEEVERLLAKFGDDSDTGRPVLFEVYGRGAEKLVGGRFEIDPALIQNNGTEVVDAKPKTKALPDLDELREQCKLLGITFKPQHKAKSLADMIEAKVAEMRELVESAGIDAEGLDPLELKGLVDDIEGEAA